MTKYIHPDDTLNIYYKVSDDTITDIVTIEDEEDNDVTSALDNLQNVKKIQWSPVEEKHGGDTFEFSIEGISKKTDVKVLEIPEINSFENPIYHWYATEGHNIEQDENINNWTDILNSISINESNTSATYNIYDELPVIKYIDEYNTFNPNEELPQSGEKISMAALVSPISNNSWAGITGLENTGILIDEGEPKTWVNNGGNAESGFNINTDEYHTLGMSYDGNDKYKIFVNGNEEGIVNRNQKPGDSTGYIANTGYGESADVRIVEIIWSKTEEKEQAFKQYHENRLK